MDFWAKGRCEADEGGKVVGGASCNKQTMQQSSIQRASETLGLALHLPVDRLTPLRIEGDGNDLRAIEKT